MLYSERPSARKVAGVSRRYLAGLETVYELNDHIMRLKNEDLSFNDANAVSYMAGYGIMKTTIIRPFQLAREEFLRHAQEVEGRVPGEEILARFALRQVNGSQVKYWRTAKRVNTPLQD